MYRVDEITNVIHFTLSKIGLMLNAPCKNENNIRDTQLNLCNTVARLVHGSEVWTVRTNNKRTYTAEMRLLM